MPIKRTPRYDAEQERVLQNIERKLQQGKTLTAEEFALYKQEIEPELEQAFQAQLEERLAQRETKEFIGKTGEQLRSASYDFHRYRQQVLDSIRSTELEITNPQDTNLIRSQLKTREKILNEISEPAATGITPQPIERPQRPGGIEGIAARVEEALFGPEPTAEGIAISGAGWLGGDAANVTANIDPATALSNIAEGISSTTRRIGQASGNILQAAVQTIQGSPLSAPGSEPQQTLTEDRTAQYIRAQEQERARAITEVSELVQPQSEAIARSETGRGAEAIYQQGKLEQERTRITLERRSKIAGSQIREMKGNRLVWALKQPFLTAEERGRIRALTAEQQVNRELSERMTGSVTPQSAIAEEYSIITGEIKESLTGREWGLIQPEEIKQMLTPGSTQLERARQQQIEAEDRIIKELETQLPEESRREIMREFSSSRQAALSAEQERIDAMKERALRKMTSATGKLGEKPEVVLPEPLPEGRTLTAQERLAILDRGVREERRTQGARMIAEATAQQEQLEANFAERRRAAAEQFAAQESARIQEGEQRSIEAREAYRRKTIGERESLRERFMTGQAREDVYLAHERIYAEMLGEDTERATAEAQRVIENRRAAMQAIEPGPAPAEDPRAARREAARRSGLARQPIIAALKKAVANEQRIYEQFLAEETYGAIEGILGPSAETRAERARTRGQQAMLTEEALGDISNLLGPEAEQTAAAEAETRRAATRPALPSSTTQPAPSIEPGPRPSASRNVPPSRGQLMLEGPVGERGGVAPFGSARDIATGPQFLQSVGEEYRATTEHLMRRLYPESTSAAEADLNRARLRRTDLVSEVLGENLSKRIGGTVRRAIDIFASDPKRARAAGRALQTIADITQGPIPSSSTNAKPTVLVQDTGSFLSAGEFAEDPVLRNVDYSVPRRMQRAFKRLAGRPPEVTPRVGGRPATRLERLFGAQTVGGRRMTPFEVSEARRQRMELRARERGTYAPLATEEETSFIEEQMMQPTAPEGPADIEAREAREAFGAPQSSTSTTEIEMQPSSRNRRQGIRGTPMEETSLMTVQDEMSEFRGRLEELRGPPMSPESQAIFERESARLLPQTQAEFESRMSGTSRSTSMTAAEVGEVLSGRRELSRRGYTRVPRGTTPGPGQTLIEPTVTGGESTQRAVFIEGRGPGRLAEPVGFGQAPTAEPDKPGFRGVLQRGARKAKAKIGEMRSGTRRPEMTRPMETELQMESLEGFTASQQEADRSRATTRTKNIVMTTAEGGGGVMGGTNVAKNTASRIAGRAGGNIAGEVVGETATAVGETAAATAGETAAITAGETAAVAAGETAAAAAGETAAIAAGEVAAEVGVTAGAAAAEAGVTAAAAATSWIPIIGEIMMAVALAVDVGVTAYNVAKGVQADREAKKSKEEASRQYWYDESQKRKVSNPYTDRSFGGRFRRTLAGTRGFSSGIDRKRSAGLSI